MTDLLEMKYGKTTPEEKVLDHGFVRIVDMMPRILPETETTADYAIAEAARCSLNRDMKTLLQDVVLNRYLMRQRHTSPFEMVEFKFDIKLPIFVARQMIRHRTANVNELSGRYAELPDDFYIPSDDNVRQQSTSNIQGSHGQVDPQVAGMFTSELFNFCEGSYETYGRFMGEGVAREQARMVLPLNIYTQWFWKIDLHNLLHFLDLRTDSHAQKEIREYAEAIIRLITPLIPATMDAWNDYSPFRGGMLLTRFEVEKIREITENMGMPVDFGAATPSTRSLTDMKVSKLENREWIEKAERLGLDHAFLRADEKDG